MVVLPRGVDGFQNHSMKYKLYIAADEQTSVALIHPVISG